VPVPTHGHTSGHTAFHLPSAGVVISGDGLITGHPLSRRDGPQVTSGFFNHDQAQTVAALDALAGLDADLLLPGHGPAHRGPVREAVAAARAAA
jgi:glyoxylase-like metal-dependent hydrolase (beta-lactamase superfamily II)